jgi:hypothetical protein
MNVKQGLIDALTGDHFVAILTHLAAAAFGGWAFLTRFGMKIDDSELCNGVFRNSGHPCIPLASWQQSMQMDLALIGLALVVVAAGIELYKQEFVREND